MKYIVTRDEDGKEHFFMFDKSINHDDFAEAQCYIKIRNPNNHREWERKYREPISAGFTDGRTCWGRSETLDLDSRPTDHLLITR